MKREAIAVVSAALVHLLLFSLIREAGLPGTADAPVARRSLPLEVEVDVGSEPRQSSQASAKELVPPAVNPAPRSLGAQGQRLRPEPVAGTPAEPGTELAPIDEVVPEARAMAPPIDLGIGDGAWQRWISDPNTQGSEPLDRGRRPLVRAPIASSTGGLREGLEARDRALGLGPSGRVITALRGAARGRHAPQSGKARFLVTITRAGDVEVALGTSSEPADAWRTVAARAAADLRRNPPRIPAGRSGARLTLDVIAEEAYPSGVKRKDLRGIHAELAPPRLRSTEEGRKEIEELNPTAGTDGVPLSETIANTETPGVFASGQGKVCKYRAGATPLGTLQAPPGNREREPGLEFRIQGACDPSQLEAKSQRVVRVAIVAESMF